MEFKSLTYRTYRSATTCPPINESEELTLEKSKNGYILYSVSTYNANVQKSFYTVSEEQAQSIQELFRLLDIYTECKKECPYERIAVPGGSSGASVTVITDSEETDTDYFTEKTEEFIRRFSALKNECGKPYKTEGEPPCIPGGIPADAAFAAPEPAEDKTPKEGEWVCGICGYAHNTGNFCCECGSYRNND